MVRVRPVVGNQAAVGQFTQEQATTPGIAANVGQAKAVNYLLGAGEVGMHFPAVAIGDGQQRRVAQVFAVLEELVVGGGEVGATALILDTKLTGPPYVGEAATATNFAGTTLEGIEIAAWINITRLRLTEGFAEVEPVLLRG